MKQVTKTLIAIILIIGLYLLGSRAYAYLVSNINAVTNAPVASWVIKINSSNMTTTNDLDLSFNNITWVNSHANSTKVAPGSTGSFTITLDADATKVAVAYTITVNDHTVNPANILTVTSINADGVALVPNEDGAYEGLISLSEVLAHTTKTITVNVAWLNDEANNESDSAIGLGTNTGVSYLTLHFKAMQYNG